MIYIFILQSSLLARKKCLNVLEVRVQFLFSAVKSELICLHAPESLMRKILMSFGKMVFASVMSLTILAFTGLVLNWEGVGPMLERAVC